MSGDTSHPANRGRLCSKGANLHQTIDLGDRLLHPWVRGRRTGWDQALAAVADGFSRTVAEHGPEAVAFYVSGQLLTEDYYAANKLMKGFIGGANIDTNSRLCMSSAVAGHQRAFGADAVPCTYDDLEAADLIVLVGSNTAWCHPVVYRRIEAARAARAQMRLVVIDPRRTTTAEDADLHLPIAPGWDVSLFNGLLVHLAEHGAMDQAFLGRHVAGAAEALAAAREDGEGGIVGLARASGLDPTDLQTFFDWFTKTERVVTLFSQGINQSSAGTDKVNAIINCHLLTGRIGKPGAGPFSITGQPNAMGGREVGGLATTLAAHRSFDAHESVAEFWGAPHIATRPGLKAVDMFEAIAEGQIKAVWIIATNPVVSMPDADAARRALQGCPLVVVSDCMAATDTVACADIRLPAAAWGEKDGTVTNSERCISRQRAFLPMPDDARPDWWIISQVARRMGYGDAFSYDGPRDLFIEHAALSAYRNNGRYAFDIGALASLTPDAYDALTPTYWPCPSGSEPSSEPVRLFADGHFFTEDRRGRLIAVRQRPPVNGPGAHYPLVLNTGRIRDQWHTMTRTGKSPQLSAHIPEPYVAVHPQDAQVAGIRDGELAEVNSRWGALVARVRIDHGQRRGDVFVPIHWNDQYAARARVGAVVNPVVDPISGEPEFKHTPVSLRPCQFAWYGFVFSRKRLPIAGQTDYWVRIHGRRFERYELACSRSPEDWTAWARILLDAGEVDTDWIEYRDAGAGYYRAAKLEHGAIAACLFIAPQTPGLPARNWLAGLFDKDGLEGVDRLNLLAGRPATAGQNEGPTVCSCFGVSESALERAILEQGLDSPEAIGKALGAGTNCGSCLPDIRALLRGAESVDG